MRAGLAQFLANGFVPARIEDIARDAGVVKQTIYNRFGGKDGLFTAVLLWAQDRTLPEERELLDYLREDHGTPEAVLIEVGVRWLRILLRKELILLRRLVMVEAARNPSFRKAWQGGAPRRFRKALSTFLRRQSRVGMLEVDDPERVAEQLIALVGSEGQAMAADGGQLDEARLHDIAAFHTRTLMRAWRPRGQSRAASAS